MDVIFARICGRTLQSISKVIIHMRQYFIWYLEPFKPPFKFPQQKRNHPLNIFIILCEITLSLQVQFVLLFTK